MTHPGTVASLPIPLRVVRPGGAPAVAHTPAPAAPAARRSAPLVPLQAQPRAPWSAPVGRGGVPGASVAGPARPASVCGPASVAAAVLAQPGLGPAALGRAVTDVVAGAVAGVAARGPRRLSPSAASGSLLVAAVAAGAVVPAVHAIDTSATDTASLSTALHSADLALAAQHGGAAVAASAASAVTASTMTALDGVTTISARTPASADAPSAAASLAKATTRARENGPLRFGVPYTAGNDATLDGQIAKALGLLGLPQRLAPGVKTIIMRESTGNADAVNNWDSNAAAGTPSKGLMQLIDATFHNAVLPSLAGKGIYDPVANITAGIRTMVANHGLDAVMDGGLRDSSGHYMGYGGGKVPHDGLGLASRS